MGFVCPRGVTVASPPGHFGLGEVSSCTVTRALNQGVLEQERGTGAVLKALDPAQGRGCSELEQLRPCPSQGFARRRLFLLLLFSIPAVFIWVFLLAGIR